ncbi:3'(2'),5'-bisphosphate nucleotidase CysQ [Pilimelia terevasa]|uniref:3'(2'),5'-bisphosphate nucleotidase CysQ n=1 Tax=Pilimelia terevasa TaxID=53372 RepID=UPI001663DC57
MGLDDPVRAGAGASPADDRDQTVAQWLAWLAGERLLDLRHVRGYADPGALRAAGDRQAHHVLRGELGRLRPGDAVLSEEDAGARGEAAADRRAADRVWIIDPLDGTREYGEQGRTDWAVHVALWERGAGLTAGAVALPARQVVLGTDAPPPPAAAGPMRVAVSRSRPPGFVSTLLERCGGVAVPMGSAGVKVCAVVTGEADAYVHAGGQYEWDSAAPVAVATAAGLHCSRLDGRPLEYNRAHPRLPDLLVCRPEHRDALLGTLAELIKTGEVLIEEGAAG